MHRRAVIASCLLAAMVLTWTPGRADTSVQYAGAGVAVVKSAGEPAAVDDGAVVCSTSGPSIGGGCLPFSGGVLVNDAVLGSAVAFQVCIDNNGDGICGGGGGGAAGDACGDQLFFSHSDDGRFHNALGPLPTTFLRGCGGGGWSGYIVFLCNAVHNAGAPHEHAPTTGTMTATTGGTGEFGDFCAPHPGQAGPGKRYVVTS
jgi:hypothetical protein